MMLHSAAHLHVPFAVLLHFAAEHTAVAMLPLQRR